MARLVKDSIVAFLTMMSMVCILPSCGEYEVLELQKESKRVADSLFKAHRDSLVVKLKEECNHNRESYYQEALDSLKRHRIEDIQNLIKK